MAGVEACLPAGRESPFSQILLNLLQGLPRTSRAPAFDSPPYLTKNIHPQGVNIFCRGGGSKSSVGSAEPPLTATRQDRYELGSVRFDSSRIQKSLDERGILVLQGWRESNPH